eukprot:1334072-Karenia_brevis.AAC.1
MRDASHTNVGSVDTGNSNHKSWHVGAVHTFVPYEHRKKVNRLGNLTDGEDSEYGDEYEETVSLPALESSDDEEAPI